MIRKNAAWLVHAYTASGGVIGMFALFAAAEGRIHDAFLLLILTLVIDATDGILARFVRVREALPHFDGAMLDNIIDLLTFVWVPVFIMWTENLLPGDLWLVVPLIASLYAYGNQDMKSPDHFFIGFPSYWNVIALYLYWFQPAPAIAVISIIIPAILAFIPTRYLYVSRNRILWKTTWALGGVWLALVVYMLRQEREDTFWVWVSLFYPLYYLLASLYIDQKVRRNALKPPAV